MCLVCRLLIANCPSRLQINKLHALLSNPISNVKSLNILNFNRNKCTFNIENIGELMRNRDINKGDREKEREKRERESSVITFQFSKNFLKCTCAFLIAYCSYFMTALYS